MACTHYTLPGYGKSSYNKKKFFEKTSAATKLRLEIYILFISVFQSNFPNLTQIFKGEPPAWSYLWLYSPEDEEINMSYRVLFNQPIFFDMAPPP